MGRLDGKVAIITGGGNGMGAAACVLFAKEGCKVAISDRLEDGGRSVEKQISEAGGDAFFVHMDVASEEDWKRAVDEVVRRYGKLNVLVQFAGLSGTIYQDHYDSDGWDRYMAINAKGPFLGFKYCYPRDEGGRRRFGGQLRLSLCAGRFARQPPWVPRFQGRPAAVHQGHCLQARAGEHPGKLPAPGQDASHDHLRHHLC